MKGGMKVGEKKLRGGEKKVGRKGEREGSEEGRRRRRGKRGTLKRLRKAKLEHAEAEGSGREAETSCPAAAQFPRGP